MVTYLLRTFVTVENIAITEDEMTMSSQPPNKIPSQYVEELVAFKLWCGDVYEEQDINEIFIEELEKSIRQSKGGYWPSESQLGYMT